MALRASAPVLCLAVVSLLGATHAATHAVVRPLYQVSDEVVYLGSVQAAAAAPSADGSANACLAPPDGRFLEFPATTKPGFRQLNVWVLRSICGAGMPGSALVWLRLAQSVSLAVVAACAWGMARVLTGRTTDALLAGVVAASHPVAATVAGGVTPDAWANAFSAFAFLAATRLSLGRYRWWDPPLLDTARYYWDAYPSLPNTSALFVRGTGGAVLDDALLLSTIRHGAAHLPRALPLLCLSLLAVLSATCPWLGAVATSRQETPTCPTR